MYKALFLVLFYIGWCRGSPVETYCPRTAPPDYHSADTEDCQIFYKCFQGVWVRQQCQLNLHFDIVSNTCNWPSEGDCLMNLAMSGGTRRCSPCMSCLKTMKCPSISMLAMNLAASVGIRPCKPCLHWLKLMRHPKMSKTAMFFAMLVGKHACKPCVHWLKLMKCEIIPTPVKCPVRCSPVGGVCNLANSSCDCHPGYQGVACTEDIDECTQQPSLCSADSNQFCLNTPGSYTCNCTSGYTLDQISGRCVVSCPVPCSQVGGICDYSNSRCDCLQGYQGNACTEDIDECAQQPSLCSFASNQVCVNTQGSYTCDCDQDYTRDVITGLCVSCPVQCSQVGGVCDRLNSRCDCRSGYKGVACSEDINECADQPSLCSADPNQFCDNTPGSYRCNCTSGYTLISGRCVTCPVHCSSIGGVCDRINSKCDCLPGYKGNACSEDIDECTQQPTICLLGSHKVCVNTPGSYMCECTQGYTQNTRFGGCVDIDECAQQPFLCSHNSNQVCVNTPGNFTCQCVQGYTHDAISGRCNDIDECALQPSPCNADPNQLCVNTQGSYTCNCYRGYTRDAASGLCLSDSCPVLCYSVGGVCDRLNSRCNCRPGYRGIGCFQDIDECVQQPSVCSADSNQVCVNTQGSYTCQCVQGYTRELITGRCVSEDSCDECKCCKECEAPYDKTSTCTSYPCLVFEDEFNTLDLKLWEHEITAGGGGNWEFQYYTNNRSNSYVRDGNLFLKPTLTTERFGEEFLTTGELNLWGTTPADACTGPQFYGCQRQGFTGQVLNPVQSARVRSAKSFNFKYGRLEVEAKLPTGDWIWPAIWLLPRYQAYGPWPASGEIDLVESRGNLNLTDEQGRSVGVDSVGSTLHFGPFAEANDWSKAHADTLAQSGTFGDSFHKYRMDWDEDAIKFFVDDKEILNVDPGAGGFWDLGEFEKDGGGHYNNPWAGRGKMAPFDQEFYIIMNVAVGGMNYFRDTLVNSPYAKPWSDNSGHAATDFWNARNLWLPTWHLDQNHGEDAALQVNYVKVWKLKPEV